MVATNVLPSRPVLREPEGETPSGHSPCPDPESPSSTSSRRLSMAAGSWQFSTVTPMRSGAWCGHLIAAEWRPPAAIAPPGSRIPTQGLNWPCFGATMRVVSVVWAPDGSRLATTSDDNTIRLWNGASLICVMLTATARGTHGCLKLSRVIRGPSTADLGECGLPRPRLLSDHRRTFNSG